MRALVFETPGLIDLRAFTTFGVNSKPNSANPIGFFGTGLKYAVAVLVRLGVEPVVWIGHARYRFVKREDEFRGKAFNFIAIEHARFAFAPNTATELPFTTELGKHWAPWMAYRELECNTLDEGGRTWVAENVDEIDGVADTTRIIVPGEEFVGIHEARGEVFLPDGMTRQAGTEKIEVFDRPSRHVYYRGLRVLELPKEALFTYNVLQSTLLTEDRTLYGDWQVRDLIAEHVARSDDAVATKRLLLAKPDAYEHGLSFDSVKERPSDVFVSAVASVGVSVAPAAARYIAAHERPTGSEPQTTWIKYPRPWAVRSVGMKIVDATGRMVAKYSEDVPLEDRVRVLQDIVAAVNAYDVGSSVVEEEDDATQ